VLDSLQNSASQIGQDISNIFSGSKSMTTGQLFEQLGNDFLEGAIDGVEQLTLALMKVLAKILRELAKLGNKTINIPIFSALYKLISGGHDLTIFDAISLLIAIPTTILTKAITGKAPPKFPPIDAKLLGRIITDDPTLDRAVKINFSTLSTGIMVSVVVVKSVVNLIRLIASAASDGSGGVIEFLTPSKTMALLSLSIDIIGTVHAMPTNSKVPGYELRKWISYLTLFRAGTNLLVSVTSVGGKTAEKALLVSDVLVTLVNFGLYQAVYYAEGQATVQQWPEKDDPGTIMGISGNTLNTIAGVGWFTTMMFKLEQPEITVPTLPLLANYPLLTIVSRPSGPSSSKPERSAWQSWKGLCSAMHTGSRFKLDCRLQIFERDGEGSLSATFIYHECSLSYAVSYVAVPAAKFL
jgi:hypothetical protein